MQRGCTICCNRFVEEFGTWVILTGLDHSLCWTHHAVIGKYLHIVHRTAELLCYLPSDAAYSLIAVGLHTQTHNCIFCIQIRQSKSQSESTNTKQIPVFVNITLGLHRLATCHPSMLFNAPNRENVYQDSTSNLQFVWMSWQPKWSMCDNTSKVNVSLVDSYVTWSVTGWPWKDAPWGRMVRGTEYKSWNRKQMSCVFVCQPVLKT